MKKTRTSIFALALIALSGPALAASPLAEVPELNRWNQISSATWPLVAANTELCGKAVTPALGFTVTSSADNQPVALGVGEGSPAQQAGLQNFDEIVSLNGEKLRTRKSEQVRERFAEVLADELEAGTPVEVVYIRDGAQATVAITPVNACTFGVIYVDKQIPSNTIGTDLVQGNAIDLYAESPQQIRAYVSRGMARVILDHQGKNEKQGKAFNLLNSVAGAVTGHVAPVDGNMLASFRNAPDQDRAQDYLSVYLLARAGDDVTGIADFWSGVFANMTGNALLGRALGQSQGSQARLDGLTSARDEVLGKQQAGQPLIPSEIGGRSGS